LILVYENMEKIDPYNHKRRYFKWKEKVRNGIPDIEKENSDIILRYVTDMEKGLNVASGSSKGPRSFIRLNTIYGRMVFFARKFKELYNLDRIANVKEEQLVSFFSDMKNGTIKKEGGENYSSVDTYASIFKAFWHWHQKTSKKSGVEIAEITTDLDTKQEKPDWVYLNEEQVRKLCDNAKYEYKVLILFLFDSGIRSPTELMNIRVSDLFNSCKELNIRDDVSKTFGRRIKLMICPELLNNYIKEKELKSNDLIFSTSPAVVNKYLKRLAQRVFGDKVSEAGKKYSNLTMYDFRHCSCCYWLPRYKSESALKYRFGWKKSDKIHYYSELLGMKDTISQEDLLVDITKSDIEKQLERSNKENELLNEKMRSMEIQMAKILEVVSRLDEVRAD